MASRILLEGGCVLTLGAKTANFPRADVLIEGDRVAEVGPGLRARDAERVNAADAIVMPGFVDTHRHAWHSLFKNAGDLTGPLWDHVDPQDVYTGTLIGLLGAVEAGITSVVDWSDIPLGDDFVDAAFQAHVDAGPRTVLVVGDHRRQQALEALGRTLRAVVARVHRVPGPRTTIAFGCDDPEAAYAIDQVAGEWRLARELGLRVHAHAGTEPDGAGAISELAGLGLLSADVTLAHCTNLSDADLDAVRSSGAGVAIAPSSEMTGGLGAPPTQRLIDRNIRPGLGVDDERLAPGDLFAQMRTAISLQHATVFDRKLMGKAALPRLLSTRDIIRYATIDGARAVGLGAVTGSIEPGKQADVVVLRTDRPNVFPVNDPIGAVVWGMDTSNVDWVIAGGRVVMRGGVLQADVGKAQALAAAARERVASSSGMADREPASSGGSR